MDLIRKSLFTEQKVMCDMRRGVYKIGDEYYRIRRLDKGILTPENRGLWRASKVVWNGTEFSFVDDDDYLIDDDRRIVAREVGWALRREVMR